jgi:flagellar basal body P-ring formation protein FlgA
MTTKRGEAATKRHNGKTQRASLLGVLCAFAFHVSSPAHAGAPVELRADPVDADGQVTLGDLFEGAGPASSVLVAPGPQGSASVVLDAGRVQAAARQAGLEWANAAGVRRLVVRAGSVPSPSAAPRPAGAAAVEALVYVRSLAAGAVVTADDVTYAPVQAHQLPADAVEAEAAIGKAARRPVRAGAAVAARDLSSPRVIARDEVISVAYDVGGVKLVLQGKALAAAAVGEPVQVKNLQSGKIIQAVATGPGAAVVGPEAERLKAGVLASR